MMDVRVVETPKEREEVFRFRYRILVGELKKELPGTDHKAKLVRDEDDEAGSLIAAFARDEMVGTLRLNRLSGGVSLDLRQLYSLDLFAGVPANQVALASRFLVHSEFASAANVLSQYALGWALENGIKLAFSYCSPHMVAPYEQLGYRRYKDNFNDPLGYRVPMLLVLFDKDHLRRIGSPLYPSIAPTAENTWNDFFRKRFPEYNLPVNPRLFPQEEFWALVGEKLNSNPLESIPLFQKLTSEQASLVMETGAILPIKSGDHLLAAGSTGREFYLILKGMLGVFLPGAKKPVTLLGPGEIVGEMAFLATAPRTADVMGLQDGEVMVLSERSFLALTERHPALASQVSLNLARILSERLALTSKALAELQRELQRELAPV